jgi:hypothetical protein
MKYVYRQTSRGFWEIVATCQSLDHARQVCGEMQSKDPTSNYSINS